jgi:hypothetical protein
MYVFVSKFKNIMYAVKSDVCQNLSRLVVNVGVIFALFMC